MIRAESVIFQAGEFRLNRVSLEVKEGEYFVLLGPPGSGKTLFLEVLCGLRHPESGRVFIHQQNVIGLEPRQRRIGYVPQDYALFPHRSVEGNIRFGLEAERLEKSEIKRRVRGIAEKLGIQQLLPRQIAGLSGGERQRVALGRALAIRPKVLLLDEPVSALDESTREAVCRELKRIQGEFGLATIHVCHHLEEAFSVADRAGILREGSFQQIGTLDELTQKPASAFVARFMRCQNVLSGRVSGPSSRKGWVDISLGSHLIAVPGNFRGKVQIVVRPERIRLARATEQKEDPVIKLPVEIRQVYDRGSYLRIEVDASFPLVIHTMHEELANLQLDSGRKISAFIRPGNIQVLPADS